MFLRRIPRALNQNSIEFIIPQLGINPVLYCYNTEPEPVAQNKLKEMNSALKELEKDSFFSPYFEQQKQQEKKRQEAMQLAQKKQEELWNGIIKERQKQAEEHQKQYQAKLVQQEKIRVIQKTRGDLFDQFIENTYKEIKREGQKQEQIMKKVEDSENCSNQYSYKQYSFKGADGKPVQHIERSFKDSNGGTKNLSEKQVGDQVFREIVSKCKDGKEEIQRNLENQNDIEKFNEIWEKAIKGEAQHERLQEKAAPFTAKQ